MKTSLTIDMTQGFKITGTEVKRNAAEEKTSFLDVQYPVEACFCDLQNKCRGPGFGSENTLDDNFLKQDEAMRVCLRFDPNEDFPPAYVKFSDIKSFACDQGSLVHRPISNFMRAGDGLTFVEITNNVTSPTYNDRILVVSTRLPSAFYSIDSNTVTCYGIFVMEFTADTTIGTPIPAPTPARRMTAEVSIPIATTNVQRELDVQQAESEFSLEIALEAVKEPTKAGDNIGLIAGLSVAGVAVIVAGALVVSRTLPAMGIRKKSNRAESLTLDESLTDSSDQNDQKGCIA